MNPIFEAISRAFRDLFQFRILWIVLWPIVTAVLMWFVLGVVFWEFFSDWITSGLNALGIKTWLEGIEPQWIAHSIQAIAHLVLFIPLVFVTALVITALFAMPMLIRLVAERDYPQLERKNGGSVGGNVLNALLAICIFVVIWTLTIPLWLVGVGIIIPFIAAAYLNQRLFRYDALAEHASHEEMKVLFSANQSSLWGLGLLTGLVQFIPVLNLFAPVLSGLTFVHFGLRQLNDLRQHP
jgi:uncharacterized protein involved in cysteine biosynthesis